MAELGGRGLQKGQNQEAEQSLGGRNMAISGGRNVLRPGSHDSSGGRNVAESKGKRQKWEQEIFF